MRDFAAVRAGAMPDSDALTGIGKPKAFVFEMMSSAEAAVLLLLAVFLKAIELPSGLRPGIRTLSLLIWPAVMSDRGKAAFIAGAASFLMMEAVTLAVDENPVSFVLAACAACREASKDPAPVTWGSTADLAALIFPKS